MFGKKPKPETVSQIHVEISRLALEQAYMEGFNLGFQKGFELGSSDFQPEKIKNQAILETLKRLNNGNL